MSKSCIYFFGFRMYVVDIITKILLFGLLLWTIFSWSDSIIAFVLFLSKFVQQLFSSALSTFNGDTLTGSITNKEL